MSYSNSSINRRLDEVLAEARAIKYAMRHGALTYEQAKERVKPMLEQVNKACQQIAQKYKIKYKEIRFTDLG